MPVARFPEGLADTYVKNSELSINTYHTKAESPSGKLTRKHIKHRSSVPEGCGSPYLKGVELRILLFSVQRFSGSDWGIYV
jgi:hypothetical protein